MRIEKEKRDILIINNMGNSNSLDQSEWDVELAETEQDTLGIDDEFCESDIGKCCMMFMFMLMFMAFFILMLAYRT